MGLQACCSPDPQDSERLCKDVDQANREQVALLAFAGHCGLLAACRWAACKHAPPCHAAAIGLNPSLGSAAMPWSSVIDRPINQLPTTVISGKGNCPLRDACSNAGIVWVPEPGVWGPPCL